MRRLICLLAVVFTAMAAEPARAELPMPNMWVARFSTFKGNLACNYGDHDCNRCVHNVVEQFKDLTQRTTHTTRVKQWEWDRLTNYQPSGHKATDILKANPDNGHFQSFVRAPTDDLSGVPTYFSAHSDNTREQGGIFFSRGGADSRGRALDGTLKYIYRGSTNHPGGMQAVGHYLLTASEVFGSSTAPGRLDIINIPLTPTAPRVTAMFPNIGAGATAVAAQRVAGGGYLLLVWKNSKSNAAQLFYTPSLETVRLERVLAQDVKADWNPGWTKDGEPREGYENLSLITECGTGKPYVIASNARDFKLDGGGATYAGGKSVWALYDLVPGTTNALRFITKNSLDMFTEECDPRAAGTGFAGRNGELGLYCHQKLQDEATRRNGLLCGVSGIGVLAGAGWLAPVAAGFCGKTATADRTIFFTEYWPTEPAEHEISITVRGSGTVWNLGRVGVMDAGSGRICDAPEGLSRTCKWTYPTGSQIMLVPLLHPEWEYANWAGQCQERNGLSVDDSSFPAECTRTVNGALNFELVATAEIYM